MNLHIEVDDREVRAWLSKLARIGDDMQPTLAKIGHSVAENTRLRFSESKAPDGSQWAPLSPVTRALRRKGRGFGSDLPLLDTGRLRNSITYSASNNDVVIGTNVEYGRTQHFGARKGEFGRYSQVGRVRKYGLGTFQGSAGTKKGFPIPWGNIPARPFLGVSAEDRSQIIGIIRNRLQESTQ